MFQISDTVFIFLAVLNVVIVTGHFLVTFLIVSFLKNEIRTF